MKKYSLIDISIPLSPKTPVWPGSKKIKFSRSKSIKGGNASNDSDISLSAHAGTHIDAPLHFIDGGKPIEGIFLNKLIGDVYVADIPGVKEINARLLDKCRIPNTVKKILFKTSNSRIWDKRPLVFCKDFVALTPDAAEWLVKHGKELVGIDYFSVQKFYDGPDVHRILLKAGVILLEGLDLRVVKKGRYVLFCLPLKLTGLEAAPVRAVLLNPNCALDNGEYD